MRDAGGYCDNLAATKRAPSMGLARASFTFDVSSSDVDRRPYMRPSWAPATCGGDVRLRAGAPHNYNTVIKHK